MIAFEIVAEFGQLLEAAGIPFLVGGSLASSAWGQPRQTNDADLALQISRAAAERLVDLVRDPYYISRSELMDAVSSQDVYRTVQVLHMDEAFKLDLFLVGTDEYTTTEFERIRRTVVLPGLILPLAAPENILIQKFRWYELGHRVSDRQWNDIVQVIEVQRGHLDTAYLRKWCIHFGLEELLDEAVDQALGF